MIFYCKSEIPEKYFPFMHIQYCEKLMFKYRLNAERVPDPGCCGSFRACLDSMVLRIKSALGLGFFLHSSMFSYMFNTPCIHRL